MTFEVENRKELIVSIENCLTLIYTPLFCSENILFRGLFSLKFSSYPKNKLKIS